MDKNIRRERNALTFFHFSIAQCVVSLICLIIVATMVQDVWDSSAFVALLSTWEKSVILDIKYISLDEIEDMENPCS